MDKETFLWKAMAGELPLPKVAAILWKGEFAPMFSLNASFEKPTRVGVIQHKGGVLRRGPNVCYLSGELYQDGERVASATATALIRRQPPPEGR